MTNLFDHLAARAREPSTYAGVALLANAAHDALVAGGSSAAWTSAAIQTVTGLTAILKSEGSTKLTTVVGVAAQVETVAAEFAAITKAIQATAMAPVAAPVAVAPSAFPVGTPKAS
jgi:hypothetical protein